MEIIFVPLFLFVFFFMITALNRLEVENAILKKENACLRAKLDIWKTAAQKIQSEKEEIEW